VALALDRTPFGPTKCAKILAKKTRIYGIAMQSWPSTLRLYGLREDPRNCHPEEPQAVLSETKEGSPHLPDSTNAEVLRFAQNDSAYEFFRSLSNPWG
jgi:hypothetical protein